ncbi:MAG: hypothetical protein R3A10_11220 [Caldilineaceae bacterium]
MLAFVFSACAAPMPAGDSAPAAAGDDAAAGEAAATEGGYVIGVSNTLVGNGWRESK